MKPTVSVIIPTYNRAHLVKRAIHSVLNQTYTDFELIIVDDGSTDNTKTVVKNFTDKRIRYVKRLNGGHMAARNTGIARAKGAYIAFLDSDDEWLPTILEKQMRLFNRLPDDYGVVYTGYCHVAGGHVLASHIPSHRGWVLAHQLRCGLFTTTCFMARKSCLEEAGLFDERYQLGSEWDIGVRLAQRCQFDYIPEVLAKYHVHGDQMSKDLSGKIHSKVKYLKKHAALFVQHPLALCSWFKQLGVLYALNNDRKRSRRFFISALRSCPTDRGAYLHLILALFPPLQRRVLRKRYTAQYNNTIIY